MFITRNKGENHGDHVLLLVSKVLEEVVVEAARGVPHPGWGFGARLLGAKAGCDEEAVDRDVAEFASMVLEQARGRDVDPTQAKRREDDAVLGSRVDGQNGAQELELFIDT